MKRSTERILTTHTGSLPRPWALMTSLNKLDRGELSDVDEAHLPVLVSDAVREVVQKQRAVGVDVVNDGEAGKVSYARYVVHRLEGFGGEGRVAKLADLEDFPHWRDRVLPQSGVKWHMPACVGPVSYRGADQVKADIDNLTDALGGVDQKEAFLSAVSPGVIALFFENRYYASQEDYLFALADAMKVEYDAIAAAGLVVQLDCPDLARGRHEAFAGLSVDGWHRAVNLHLGALNHALRDVPAEQLRMHICWGNYEGPHHHDVPLRDVLDLVLSAKPLGIAFEAANPRHEHEWNVFEELRLPEGTILIPGVIDSTTNYIEHPELVAQRVVRLAGLVGRENVIAGTDCGFATGASTAHVDPAIAWAKLGSLAEGAEVASKELWPAERATRQTGSASELSSP